MREMFPNLRFFFLQIFFNLYFLLQFVVPQSWTTSVPYSHIVIFNSFNYRQERGKDKRPTLNENGESFPTQFK